MLAEVSLDAAFVDAPGHGEGWGWIGPEAGARAGVRAGNGMAVGVGGCALVLLVNSSLVQGVAAAGENILRALAFACEGRVGSAWYSF